MTTPKMFKSQTLDFGPAMPFQLSKKPTKNEPHVAKMRWFNIGSWTAVPVLSLTPDGSYLSDFHISP